MNCTNRKYALALHGGAGPVAGRKYDVVEDHLRGLTAECEKLLATGRSALDVVEFAVDQLERSGLYVAGRGSAPNSEGYVELDASIMDGRTRAAGGVAALPGFVSAVRVARGVMEKTAHVLLTGNGARAFAAREGYEQVLNPLDYYRIPIGVTADDMSKASAHGTVGAVALDQSGALAAATATGGTFGKLEGRVGDTPLIGSGTWADDDIAISFTGIGEHIIRAGGATAVASAVSNGKDIEQAVADVLDEIKRLGGDAGVIAVSRNGKIAERWNSEGLKRASVSSDQPLSVGVFA